MAFESTLYENINVKFLFLIVCNLDVDECITGNHDCDVNANCINTVGGHNCTCKKGFAGDGRSCSGKLALMFIFSSCSYSGRTIPLHHSFTPELTPSPLPSLSVRDSESRGEEPHMKRQGMVVGMWAFLELH